MSFLKYAEYKESGVEWLGEIPAGWTTQKLKFVARVQPSNVDKKSKKDEKGVLLCNYTDVYYNEEITADLPFMKATASDVQIRKFTLKSGDTIITKDSEDPNDIAVPAYVPQDLDSVVCGYHLALLRPEKGTCGGYLKRVMDTQYARSFFATRANGITRYGLGTYAISNFILPFPPLEEQKQIAAFLDKETTNIDTLIDKQEQLITLLQEKRQAIISHAVTRGLNPNVKMKESGIEWLGEVPEHWEVTKLGYIAKKIGSGKTPRGGSEVYLREGILFLRSQNVHDTGLMLRKKEAVYISVEIDSEMSATRVKPGDILLNITGASIGRTCIVPANFPRANVNQHVCIIRVPENLQYYLSYFLKSVFVKSQIDAFQTGASREGLNFEQISKIFLCIPPKQEQNRIIAYLDKETAKIDTLIEKCETAIELLRERRTALISAAVTGKIDVGDVG